MNRKPNFEAFTGHGWSQRAPCQPAVQVQDPSAGLHFAPLEQWQVALHPGPQVPSEQGVEQSGPRQPADIPRTVSHVGLEVILPNLSGNQPSLCFYYLPSLQKQVPSTGEQSTKFLQEHSREQFLP